LRLRTTQGPTIHSPKSPPRFDEKKNIAAMAGPHISGAFHRRGPACSWPCAHPENQISAPHCQRSTEKRSGPSGEACGSASPHVDKGGEVNSRPTTGAESTHEYGKKTSCLVIGKDKCVLIQPRSAAVCVSGWQRATTRSAARGIGTNNQVMAFIIGTNEGDSI